MRLPAAAFLGLEFVLWAAAGVGASESGGCVFVGEGHVSPTNGTFRTEDWSWSGSVALGASAPSNGVFCASCANVPTGSPCPSSFMCSSVPKDYIAQSDGDFTPTGSSTSLPVTYGQVAPSAGTFCPACYRVERGGSSTRRGRFITDDGNTVLEVEVGTLAPVAGTFCAQTGNETSEPVASPATWLHELALSPRWTSFKGLAESKGLLSGSLTVEMEWYWVGDEETGYAYGMIGGEPSDAVDLSNFASGASGRVKLSQFKVTTPLDDKGNEVHYRKTAIIYVGDFHQSVDGTCYPWDTQMMRFEFNLPSPFDKVMQLVLTCPDGEEKCELSCGNGMCAEPLDKTQVTEIRYTTFDGAVAKNFRWSAFSCSKRGTKSIVCTMQGQRDVSKAFVLQIVPGLLMSIIGFAAFLIPANMAMPRVATTMIALLTFVGKGTAVMSVMPTSGLSIVEEFYLWGMGVMLLNMIGHILSWKLPAITDLIIELQLGFTVFLFVLILAASLQGRQCEGVSSVWTIVVIVLASLLLVVSGCWSVWKHRSDLRALHSGVHQKMKKIRIKKGNQTPAKVGSYDETGTNGPYREEDEAPGQPSTSADEDDAEPL